jgi:hypothetical protein
MAIVEHRQHASTNTNTLTAKSIKATIVLSPAEVLALATPDGKPRCIVRVTVSDRTITADLNAKSVRKAIATIKEAGPDNISCVLQGKLGAANQLEEAGLAVQLKTKPPTPPIKGTARG